MKKTDLAQPNDVSALEYIATVVGSDPYDERPGPYYAAAELRALEALKPGDKLYVNRSKRGEPL